MTRIRRRAGALVDAIRSHAREWIDDAKRLWWVFVIVAPLVSLALFLAVDHANAEAARAQRATTTKLIARARAQARKEAAADRERSARQAAKDRKTRAQTVASQNKLICLIIGIVDPQLSRAIARRKTYATISPTDRALNENAIKTARRTRSQLVTIPPDYKCPEPPNPRGSS